MAQSRTMAAESRAHLHKGIPKNMAEVRNSIWLSDIGAYPIIGVLTFACGFAGSFIAWTAMCSPDVRITTGRRQQLLRTWE
eukprot:CAMPEP_0181095402 /NCGR_PEP_ID=MMETSP1071-20121207/10498_1 /TAXON_ID=35127 /ORGANISM="Thalassiosira sp., Strain NH16" /LENGTH=80 /DNA_ID=CAMNT_0023177777 /DNA_START=441 /DNA_END=683 /DNA_ORIENTATION=-